MVGTELRLRGWPWRLLSNFNINMVGFVIAGTFLVVRALAISLWRLGRFEQRWQPVARDAESSRWPH